MKLLINKQRLYEFMHGWPCSGLHDVSTIEAEFDDNGDLVDMSILGHNGEDLNTEDSDIDGYAVSCLLDDCKKEVK
tara:strand:- start:392 stop:619 length:228 start_codon:yes stop_codon:yes gene_type:complete